MSAMTPGATGIQHHNGHRTIDRWRDSTRVVLQPIAAPSILGLFGFAGATFVVAAQLARWYGTPASGQFLFPFAAFFGGLAQFTAGMWAYRARDGLATAMHGMWGSFWMAYGLLFLLGATRTLTLPTGTFTELGFWFLALAARAGLRLSRRPGAPPAAPATGASSPPRRRRSCRSSAARCSSRSC